MAFDDEKIKLSSERFTLFKVQVRRNITDLLEFSGTDNLWTYEFDQDVFAVTSDDDSGFKDNPPDGAGEWFQENGVITYWNANNSSITSDIVYLNYNLYFCTDYDRRIPKDVTSGEEVLWIGRIEKSPSLKQSIKNNVKSLRLSSSSSSISINNVDNYFEQFLSDNDSMNLSPVEVWLNINGEFKKFITGIVRSVKTGSRNVTLNITDDISRLLDNTCYIDGRNNSIYNDTKYPNIQDIDIGKPVPVHFGPDSGYELLDSSDSTGTWFDVNTLHKAVSIDADGDEWILGRTYDNLDDRADTTITPNGGYPSTNYAHDNVGDDPDTSAAASRIGSIYKDFEITNTISDIRIGDTISFEDQGEILNKKCYGVILKVKDEGSIRKITFISDSLTIGAESQIVNTNYPMKIESSISLTVDYEGLLFPLFGNKDFTISTDDNGELKTWKATFIDPPAVAAIQLHRRYPVDKNIETAALVPFASRNYPEQDDWSSAEDDIDRTATVYYKASFRRTGGTASERHVSVHRPEDIVQTLLTEATLSTVGSFGSTISSQFTNEAIWMDIPEVGNSLGTYSEYIENILKSTLSVITLDEDNSADMILLSKPTGATEIINNERIMNATASTDRDVRDLVSEIFFFNDHISINDQLNNSDLTNAVQTLTDKEPQRLRNIDKRIEYRHHFDVVPSLMAQRTMNIRSQPFVVYQIRVPIEFIDVSLFDGYRLDGPFVLGGVSNLNCVVIGFEKNENFVTLQLSPLTGL